MVSDSFVSLFVHRSSGVVVTDQRHDQNEIVCDDKTKSITSFVVSFREWLYHGCTMGVVTVVAGRGSMVYHEIVESGRGFT